MREPQLGLGGHVHPWEFPDTSNGNPQSGDPEFMVLMTYTADFLKLHICLLYRGVCVHVCVHMFASAYIMYVHGSLKSTYSRAIFLFLETGSLSELRVHLFS